MSRRQTPMVLRFAPLAGGTLCATLLATTALAQPAPNAQPMGGQVTAGQASISQSATATTINQASQRAVVNWQSFNVGANQSVQFVQPSSTAATLNRVLSPDPSQIAGRITANGQIVLQNQSGVVFTKSAQVDASSLVVSAPGITNQNFMAGKMVFDIPAQPNARIVNNGRITVKQSGLAALVAPQVANNGVITAKMGHVVLAGAQTETIDLYGDGMVSINVTGQVTQAPVGPDGKPVKALVTNSGVVAAPGGTVELTARAVDGLVQTLVTAGGHIAAPTIAGHTGKIVVSGIGGSVIVEGDVSADGIAPGTTGGTIALNSSRGVTVGGHAHIDASGAAGGGTIAIGTTLARARGGPSVTSSRTAATAKIANGALVAANATQSGNGGTVVVLSSRATSASGEIDARGGPQGGNGGHVELSGQSGFALNGKVNVTAQSTAGLAGTILIDPRDLYISATNPVTLGEASSDTNLTSGTPASSPGSLPNSSTDAWVTPTAINNLSGAVTLTATRDLDVLTTLDTTGSGITALTLDAGRNLTVYAGAPITTSGNLTLSAGNAVASYAALTAGGSVAVIDQFNLGTSPTGNGMLLEGTTTAGTGQTISLAAAGGYSFQIASVPQGTLEVGPSTTAAAANFGIGVGSSGTGIVASTVRIGTTSLPGAPVAVNLQLGNATFGPNINNYGSATLELHATGTVAEYATSGIEAAALTGSVGTLSLPNAGNSIGTLGPLAATGDITLTTNSSLFVGGALTAGGNIALIADNALIANATITATGSVALTDLFLSGVAPVGYQYGMTLNQPVTAGTGQTISLSVAGYDYYDQLIAPQGTVEKGPSTTLYQNDFISTGGSSGNGIVANVYRVGTTSLPGALIASSLAFGDASYTGVSNYGAVTLELHTTGAVTQYATNSLEAGALTGSVGSVNLPNAGNSIGTLGPLTATSNVSLATSGSLFVNGPLVAGGNIALVADDSLIANAAINARGSIALTDEFLSGVAPVGYQFGMTLNQPVTAGAGQTISLAVAGGNQTAALSFDQLTAPLGAVEEGPSTPLYQSNFGANNNTTGTIVAGTVRIGTTSLQEALVATNLIFSGTNDYGTASLDLHATGAVQQGAGSTIAAGTLTGSVGSLTFANTGNSFGALGPLGATGNVTLADSVPLSLDGRLTASTLNITTPGAITQTAASTVDVAALTGSVASLKLPNTGNSIGTLGPFAATGNVTLADSAPLSLDGLLTAGTFSITTPGAVTQTAASTIDVAVFTGSAASLNLPNADNSIGTLGPFASNGNVTLADSVPLSLDGLLTASTLSITTPGAVTQTAASTVDVAALTGSVASLDLPNTGNSFGTVGPLTATGDITLATDPPLTFNGTLTANTLSIISPETVTQTAASKIDVATLTGSVASLNLPNTGNSIGTLGPFAATGNVTVTDSGPLSLNGLLTANTLNITTPGAVTQTAASTVDVATFTGSAASLDLPNTGNSIGTLGAFAATGNVTLADSIPLSLDGALTASTLNITTPGAVTQTAASTVDVATFTGSAASLDLPNTGNTIGTLGPFAATGNVTLADSLPLSLDGLVTAATLTITTPGAVTQTGASTIDVAAISGSAASLDLPNTGNSIASLGPFTATAGIALRSGVPLVIAGTLSGNDISIDAVGTLTLAANLILSGNDSGVDFTVTPGTDGTSRFVQTGTSRVTAQGNGGSVVTVNTDSQGIMTFNDLEAPDIGLILGGYGTAISGMVNVGSLEFADTGGNGSAALTNTTVGGLTGSPAAVATTITPAVNMTYLVDGCVASVGCAATPPPPPPPPAPTPPVMAETPAATPEITPPVVTQAQLQAAAIIATNIAVTTPVVTGVASVVNQIAIGSLTPDDVALGGTVTTEASTSTTGPVGTEEQGPTRTQARGVPLVNPLGEMSRGPLHNRSADPDLVVPNVSERDY